MKEYRKLVDAYLKFIDEILPANEEDEELILTSKNIINSQFEKKQLKIFDIINYNLSKLTQMSSEVGLSKEYINYVFQDLLYNSFSPSGFPMRMPKTDELSNFNVYKLINILSSIITNIEDKNSVTEIIDVIVDEFSKAK